jgi:hypothetical protein
VAAVVEVAAVAAVAAVVVVAPGVGAAGVRAVAEVRVPAQVPEPELGRVLAARAGAQGRPAAAVRRAVVTEPRRPAVARGRLATAPVPVQPDLRREAPEAGMAAA